mmetsp:Transcript_66846/g.149174  ORF Transcript_66846/g.149174 Transcript_66846/m.149174 type:complete len:265 (-) Transcript_66846:32-826(-)
MPDGLIESVSSGKVVRQSTPCGRVSSESIRHLSEHDADQGERAPSTFGVLLGTPLHCTSRCGRHLQALSHSFFTRFIFKVMGADPILQAARVDARIEPSLLQQRHQRDGIRCHRGTIKETRIKVLNAHVERPSVDPNAVGSTSGANAHALGHGPSGNIGREHLCVDALQILAISIALSTCEDDDLSTCVRNLGRHALHVGRVVERQGIKERHARRYRTLLRGLHHTQHMGHFLICSNIGRPKWEFNGEATHVDVTLDVCRSDFR